LGLFVIILVGWTMIVDDPFGGEPMAITPANLTAVSPATQPEQSTADPPEGSAPPAASTLPAPPAGKTITIIDGTSGKRQDIVIPGTADSPGGIDQRPAENSRRAVQKSDARTPARPVPTR
jgi:hypothetical protein